MEKKGVYCQDLDKHHPSWMQMQENCAKTGMARPFSGTPLDSRFLPLHPPLNL
jgi:hypothetical protein